MSRDRSESPTIIIHDDDGRGWVDQPILEPKFRVGDRVRFVDSQRGTGVFVIATVPSPGRYTLCLPGGTTQVHNGEEVDEKDLEAA
ncbi:hypothetical protein F5X98DRAFT_77799 [Xylaria grammica]|nr:hypothetical protein F5X98DRAFT_77799 [Xylaria grammica]